MRVLEFDGEHVTVEVIEPGEAVETIDARYKTRHAAAVKEHGTPLPVDIELKLSFELAADHRERLGMDRRDGKQLVTRKRRQPLEKWADQLGVSTSLPGWEQATIEAIKRTPARGRIGEQS